jgi:hypothetical protein
MQNPRIMRPAGRAGRLTALLTLAACALAAEAGAPAARASGPAAPLPPQARIRVELNQLLQLHHWLMATCGAPARPEYGPACGTYRELQQADTPAPVWQFANDACALGPDIEAVRARAGRPPAGLGAAEAAAARRLLEALAAAWPVYEKNDLVALNRSLQRITQVELRQRFSLTHEPRVMGTVYDRMLLRPLDSPVTVFPVTHSTHQGDWGKTARGYYLIQPMVGQPVGESLVHELTHVLESGQPPGERTLQRRLREAGRAIPAADFEPFIHALVVYNAAETLRRAAGRDPSRSWSAAVAAWVPLFEKVWNPWLDGAAGPDETVSRLVAGFLAQGVSAPPAAP